MCRSASLLQALDAFYLGLLRCGELEGTVDRPAVSFVTLTCSYGATMVRLADPENAEEAPTT
jgi:hypothetical protein